MSLVCAARRLPQISLVILTVAGFSLAAGPAYSQSPTERAVRAWSSEVADALAAYQAGDYAGAQRLCGQLRAQSAAPRVQQDVAVLEALCLLRMPARTDRVDGRTRLQELTAEDPALWDNPECNLAYGVAETALSETAAALDALDRAATEFAAQQLPARQAAALVALAEAWAAHGEWERTPPRFDVKRPLDASQAEATRRAQIATLRERIASLPNSEDARDQLDLVLAQHLLDTGTQTTEGLAILTRVATAEPFSTAGATAAFRLAQHAGSVGDWPAALRSYERVQHEWHGELSEQAARRVQELTEPQVLVESPASVPSGQPVRVHLRVRGVTGVQIELRRVDLEAWLSAARSRSSETTLPESGSLQVARDLVTQPAVPNGWWDADESGAPLDLPASPGAYVLLVKGTQADRQTKTVKRLIVVSDLVAVCCAGPRDALLWVARRPGTAAPENGGPVTARFWMNRSFTATEVKFDGDMARFALPNEARVMRDKGWVCLVRSGEQFAVCRGKLPDAAALQSNPRVALLAGPPAPQVGQTLYVAGLLLPSDVGPLELSASESVELQVLDVLEKVQFRQTVPLSAGGAFTATIPITAKQSGMHLRVLVRYRGQALENIGERTMVSVPRVDTPGFRVYIDVPPWISPEAAQLNGVIRAEFPWRAAPAQARVEGTIQAVHLPTSAANDESVLAPEFAFAARLDDQGRASFAVPLLDFGLSRAALALTVSARVNTWDGRQGTSSAQVLVGAHPPHAWLTHQPSNPRAGQPVRFQIGWFSPQGLAVAESPAVVLTRDGANVARLPTHADRGGLSTEPWRPAERGTYEAVATIAIEDDAAFQVNQRIEVGAATSSQTDSTPELQCRAHYTRADDQTAVRVTLEGRSDQPLLVLVTAGDPHAAQSLTRLAGRADLSFPLSAGAEAGLRATVIRVEPDGFVTLCTETVAPDPDAALQVQVAAGQPDIWPGTSVPVHVTCRAPTDVAPGVTLTAWLVDATSAGRIERPPLGGRSTTTPGIPGVTLATSAEQPPAPSAEASGAEPAPPELLWRILSEGTPLWAVSLPAPTEATTLSVPVPAEPELYKLIVLARTPAGAFASAAAILDARRGVRLAIEAPARLTLGDRSVLAVRVENGYAESVDTQIRCTGGDGLHLESLHLEPPGQAPTRGQPDAPANVTLPPGGHAWVYFEAEASRVGPGQASATVAARGLEHSTAGTYEVLSPDAPAAGSASLSIHRAVEVWTGPQSAGEVQDANAPGHSHWQWVPLPPDERVLPGQFLRVTEEFVLTEPWPEMTWSQRVPPTCCPVTADQGGPQPIGPRQPTLPDALLFNVPKLGPGRNQHQYLLTVARPGACVLPAPQLRRGETSLPVAVEPAEWRLVVAAGN